MGISVTQHLLPGKLQGFLFLSPPDISLTSPALAAPVLNTKLLSLQELVSSGPGPSTLSVDVSAPWYRCSRASAQQLTLPSRDRIANQLTRRKSGGVSEVCAATPKQSLHLKNHLPFLREQGLGDLCTPGTDPSVVVRDLRTPADRGHGAQLLYKQNCRRMH